MIVNNQLLEYAPQAIADDELHQLWIELLLYPLVQFEQAYQAFVDAQRTEIEQDGTVIALQKILNNRYDPQERRIVIQDGSRNGFMLSNRRFTTISNTTYTIISGGENGVDFVVRVPQQVINTRFWTLSNSVFTVISNVTPITIPSIESGSILEQINAVVNKYKIFGKKFTISVV